MTGHKKSAVKFSQRFRLSLKKLYSTIFPQADEALAVKITCVVYINSNTNVADI